MNTFGKINIGTKFTFKGNTYIKMNETTGVSIQVTKQKVHFFAENEKIEIDNRNWKYYNKRNMFVDNGGL